MGRGGEEGIVKLVHQSVEKKDIFFMTFQLLNFYITIFQLI